MPKIPINVMPGILTEETARGANNRWKNGNRVRFHHGPPEKIGGWTSSPSEGDAIVGVPRGVFEWVSLENRGLISVGTNLRLFVRDGGLQENVTPYRSSTPAFGGSDGTLTDPFDTTDTSADVTVTHVGHGAGEGDTVYFDNATAVGGLTIDGEYTVGVVADVDTYTITAASAATSTATGGGTVDYAYEIPIGDSSGQAGLGLRHRRLWPRRIRHTAFKLRHHVPSPDLVFQPMG